MMERRKRRHCCYAERKVSLGRLQNLSVFGVYLFIFLKQRNVKLEKMFDVQFESCTIKAAIKKMC